MVRQVEIRKRRRGMLNSLDITLLPGGVADMVVSLIDDKKQQRRDFISILADCNHLLLASGYYSLICRTASPRMDFMGVMRPLAAQSKIILAKDNTSATNQAPYRQKQQGCYS